MKFDLHCHSTASDGKLSPEQILAEVQQAQLDLFALTDHDSLQGFMSLRQLNKSFVLVPGVELSSVWAGVAVHIVGLDFHVDHLAIKAIIDKLREARKERAYQIDKKLASRGMPNTLDGALQFCPDIGQVGRPHFAEYLLKMGYVDSMDKAFKLWLGAGKIADIKTQWPSMQQCTEAIVEAGGIAVIAHPLRYKMTMTKLRLLIDQFKASGGQAAEVSHPGMQPERKKQLCAYIKKQALAGSGGSDFHGHQQSWAKIGQVDAIDSDITPVWQLFKQTKV